MNRGSLLLVALLIVGVWKHSNGVVSADPGVLAAGEPVQVEIEKPTPFHHNDVTIEPVAHFEVKAKVLGKKRYFFDNTADISSYDFALGWGRMSDQQIVDQINIRQSNRWYYWSSDRLVLPIEEIARSSSNMHLVHKNDAIKDALGKVREGQIVHIKGYLINAVYPDGGRWRSSLTREDRGNGACEVVFVEEVIVL